MAQELYEATQFQRTPVDISTVQYCKMIVRAIRRVWVDTGRAMFFDSSMIIYDDDVPEMPVKLNAEIKIDEQEAIMLAAQIEFYRMVQSDVNNIVGYTTDALSVTNADKPFANIQMTLTDLENRYKAVLHKHVRFMML